MLMIRRAGNGEVVFTVSGQMDRGNVAELQSIISSEATGRRIVLDLEDLILADQDVVSFLVRCEADGIQLKNCPAYIREWVLRERKTRSSD
jgi:anti-anti-sigma regulatory factor